jgi:hypothetical protein
MQILPSGVEGENGVARGFELMVFDGPAGSDVRVLGGHALWCGELALATNLRHAAVVSGVYDSVISSR